MPTEKLTQKLLHREERCGPYTVLSELGRGGFGVVYLAAGPTGERVALKVCPLTESQPEELIGRFQREIHVVAAITHANLVRFYDAGRHDGPYGSALWMALEYLEGKTLRQVITTRGGVPLDEALSYCVQIADGLGALHSLGVIHRDVKPENVMLVSGGIVKVFDLGIAKVTGSLNTTTNMMLGTAPYMAPEQFESSARGAIGPWTDVYAVGLLLYELVTGKHPICPEDSLSAAETMARALVYSPPPLTQLTATASAEVSAVAEKAIAKKAADRFRTMADLREALNGALVRQRLQAHAGKLAAVGGDWKPGVAATEVPMSTEPPTTEPLPPKKPDPRLASEAETRAEVPRAEPRRMNEVLGASAPSPEAVSRPARSGPGGLAYGVFSLAGVLVGFIAAAGVLAGVAIVRSPRLRSARSEPQVVTASANRPSTQPSGNAEKTEKGGTTWSVPARSGDPVATGTASQAAPSAGLRSSPPPPPPPPPPPARPAPSKGKAPLVIGDDVN